MLSTQTTSPPSVCPPHPFLLNHAPSLAEKKALVRSDNATRSLVSQGRLSITAGTFFSLGHSSIVVVVNIAIAASAAVYDNLGGPSLSLSPLLHIWAYRRNDR